MKMLIDSQWVDSSNGECVEVRNPATGEVLGQVPNGTLEDAQRCVEAAQHGKDAMARLPAHERAAILTRAADRIDANLEYLGRLLASENGKPIQQTRDEVRVAARIFRGFAEEAKRIFGKVTPLDAVPGNERHMAITIRQPLGVVAAIIPFNYPVELYAHKAAAALAAGNAVIAKPPPECPLALLEIAGYLEEAGLPRAAHQMITGPGVLIGEYLATTPGVQLIAVTGSTNTGKRISELASQTLKQVHLELGGNDAMIICADADLEKAAEAIVLGRLARGNGQICCAVKRILVNAPAYDDLAAVLTEKAKALKVGSQLEDDTDVGPLISVRAAERVEAAINQAVSAGARVTAGGHRRDAFIEPTVLTHVPQSVPLFADEVFGPVAPLVPFERVDEAVAIANQSPYGLQAAVFTTDITRAFDIAYRLQVGGVIVNWSTALRVETLPFGGVKLTGHGREGLHDTIEAMTFQKTIIVHNALSIYSPE
ncbi:MAG: aldehyde dehydrogenase family protein [Anaerolineae bacterium]